MRSPIGSRQAAGVVCNTVEIAAPPPAVFHALSDPIELAAWLGDRSGGAASHDAGWTAPSLAVAGQSWRARAIGPDGAPGWVSGEYLRVDSPRCLESTWRASWDHFSPDHVRFDLTPIDIGGVVGTRLAVTHTRASARLQVTASAASTRGEWPAILVRLAARLAATPDVRQPREWLPPGDTFSYGDIIDLTARVRSHGD
jgi:uncharacterized protein YndB with AHSA1/START domain